jgi:hypothetical protein
MWDKVDMPDNIFGGFSRDGFFVLTINIYGWGENQKYTDILATAEIIADENNIIIDKKEIYHREEAKALPIVRQLMAKAFRLLSERVNGEVNEKRP